MSNIVAVASQRIAEAGLLFGIAGALVLAVGALSFLRAQTMGRVPHRTRERQTTAVGAILLAVGFLLQLVAMLAE